MTQPLISAVQDKAAAVRGLQVEKERQGRAIGQLQEASAQHEARLADLQRKLHAAKAAVGTGDTITREQVCPPPPL